MIFLIRFLDILGKPIKICFNILSFSQHERASKKKSHIPKNTQKPVQSTTNIHQPQLFHQLFHRSGVKGLESTTVQVPQRRDHLVVLVQQLLHLRIAVASKNWAMFAPKNREKIWEYMGISDGRNI